MRSSILLAVLMGSDFRLASIFRAHAGMGIWEFGETVVDQWVGHAREANSSPRKLR